MKWMKAVVCTTLLALSGMAFCDEIQTESPRDYAFGRSLETSVPSQWYRVLLPLAVYEQSTSPNLDDVRVFNQSGEPVQPGHRDAPAGGGAIHGAASFSSGRLTACRGARCRSEQ